MVNKIYGAEAFRIKEDSKMNITQGVRDEQAKNNVRRNIMNKLEVGDTICTSVNMTTPLEITKLDYEHYQIRVKSHLYGEGYEEIRWFWVDPLTITDRPVRKALYTDYYDTMGWHEPTKNITHNGVSYCSRCKYCGKRIIQDSQGIWF